MATTSQIQPTEEATGQGAQVGRARPDLQHRHRHRLGRPAYSLAATLAFIVAVVALQSPAIAVLAFVPMLFCSIGYSEMNKADPDCGTTFTWATRAFGPRTRAGRAAGRSSPPTSWSWPAWPRSPGSTSSCSFNANGIGSNPASGWVLLVGVLWIVAMTYICYRGIEVSANFQKALLCIELGMLLVFSVVALVRVGTGHHPAVSLHPSLGLAEPLPRVELQRVRRRPDPDGVHLLGLGHRRLGQRGDQGPDQDPRPGGDPVHALLLVTYGVVIFAAQSFAGIGSTGIGLLNPRPRQRRDLGARQRGLRQRRARLRSSATC